MEMYDFFTNDSNKGDFTSYLTARDSLDKLSSNQQDPKIKQCLQKIIYAIKKIERMPMYNEEKKEILNEITNALGAINQAVSNPKDQSSLMTLINQSKNIKDAANPKLKKFSGLMALLGMTLCVLGVLALPSVALVGPLGLGGGIALMGAGISLLAGAGFSYQKSKGYGLRDEMEQLSRTLSQQT